MIILKFGGGKDINVKGIIEGLNKLDEKFLIVHGANYIRDKLFEDLGKEKKVLTSISGYSSVFSDEDMIDTIMMSYAGLVNQRIVELCQRNGINAIGLSGIDGGLIRGKRNSGIKINKGGKILLKRDFSGKPKEVNTDLLNLLLKNGYVPVISIPILDESGYAINSENDDILVTLKEAISADTIISFIEAPGFLKNKDDESSIINNISESDLGFWESAVDGRMKRKILALRKLFEKGSCKVILSDGRVEDPISDALNGKGTVIG